MYHGYHFVYLVLFLFIFYGIFVKKTLPEDNQITFCINKVVMVIKLTFVLIKW